MKCLVIMPFRPEFDPVYETIRQAIAACAQGEALTSLRLHEIQAAGRISHDLTVELDAAAFCIADVSDLNPNVMWEVGYAAALGKPTILLAHSTQHLPFDLRDFRHVRYDLAAVESTLLSPLIDAIRQTLSRYRLRQMPLPATKTATTTIAVTGSLHADPTRVRQRLPLLLPRYMGSNTIWYCGTVGTVDELTAEFLLEREQRLMAVGYGAWDVSPTMLQTLEKYGASFVDAEQEQLLKIAGAPTARDLLYLCRRATL